MSTAPAPAPAPAPAAPATMAAPHHHGNAPVTMISRTPVPGSTLEVDHVLRHLQA